MLIGIDASQAAKEKKTGVENFSYQLILNLLLYDKKNKYILFSDHPIDFPKKFTNAKVLISKSQRFWHNLKLPRLISATKPDVFISPGYMIPIASSSKMISIVHDFAYKYFPKAYSQKDRFLQKVSISRAVSKSKAIIAMSQNTLSDLNKFYPTYKGIKVVVHQGYNAEQFNYESNGSKYRPVKGKYILSLGRLEERKNIKNLVVAYKILREKYPKITHKLVLSGNKGFGFNSIKQGIANLGEIEKDVVILGFVQEDHLYSLYKNADIFVYPTLYEGFGIPILESFAAGTPVVCSGTSSLPEVGGNACEYFNPTDPNDMAETMYRTITDKKLRAKMISESSKQLHKFEWENTAKEFLNIIEKVQNEK